MITKKPISSKRCEALFKLIEDIPFTPPVAQAAQRRKECATRLR